MSFVQATIFYDVAAEEFCRSGIMSDGAFRSSQLLPSTLVTVAARFLVLGWVLGLRLSCQAKLSGFRESLVLQNGIFEAFFPLTMFPWYHGTIQVSS